MHPDLILFNARLYTQWAEQPQAQALAAFGGRIVALGDDAELLAMAGPRTRRVDGAGRFGMAGLCDAHIHFHDWALSRQGTVELWGSASLAAMQERLRGRAATLPPGRWLLGRGWVETEWAVPTMPTAADLDAVSTEHPILCWRTDMHGAVANTAALRAAAITRATPQPDGGIVERDEHGDATGRFFETAIGLVSDAIPAATDAERDAALRDAISHCHRLGLTALHDQRMMGGGEGGPALRAYGRLRAAGELPLRLTTNLYAGERAAAFALGLHSGFGDSRLQLGHLKFFADGSLGSQTAWMLEPYEGQSSVGVNVTPPGEMQRIIREAQRHGWAISVHAIGDRANREVLDLFEELAAERDARLPLPHRIEHVQTIHPADLPRLARLGIVASVQPIHATDDWVAVERHWGARAANAYPFRQLLAQGTVLAFGSDAPVADPNPFAGIHAAVTRQRRDGSPLGGWHPAERLTVGEALHGYTVGAALAAGRAHELGRLAPGFHADVVLLDRDPFASAPEALAETRVEQLIFDGELAWQRP